jgi:hypothetical protein
VQQTPLTLSDGDMLSVGGEEVEVRLGSAVLSRRPGSIADEETQNKLSRASLVPPPEGGDDSRPTLVSNALDVVGNVAERMIQSGHGRNAEDMLRGHLIAIRDDVALRRKVAHKTQDRAIELALALAAALHKADWFDYAVDLLRARDGEFPMPLIHKLGTTLPNVSRVDTSKLTRLALALRSGTPDLDRLRAAQMLDQLVERSAREQR